MYLVFLLVTKCINRFDLTFTPLKTYISLKKVSNYAGGSTLKSLHLNLKMIKVMNQHLPSVKMAKKMLRDLLLSSFSVSVS